MQVGGAVGVGGVGGARGECPDEGVECLVGSGAGVQQITAQTVDFGASDTPLKDSEQAAAPAPILHIPLTLGAVVPAYNIKGIPSGLKFDGPTLGKIFAGQITSWDDPALVALNPGADLP